MGQAGENHPTAFSAISGEDGKIYQINNPTGTGTVLTYKVFPGVFLMYNDFQMAQYHDQFQVAGDLFCIDHCRAGRLEYEARAGSYSYVEAGDLKIDSRVNHEGRFSFPLAHYHGLTVCFQLAEAAAALPKELKAFPVDLYQLQEKFCRDDWPYLIREAPAIDHVMGELYQVPEKIRMPYFKVKILELLLYLDALEWPHQNAERPYFYKTQVEKIKAMHELLTENLEIHYTLVELAQRFEISLTGMKQCFKAVYGHPVNTYMRIYRMNQAALSLKQEKNLSVTEIAGRVGYDSASKFAASFKKLMGQTPLEYRQNHSLLLNQKTD